MRRFITTLLTAGTLLHAQGYEAPQRYGRYLDSLRSMPGLVRLYTFDRAAEELPDLAGSEKMIKLGGEKPQSVIEVAGRLEGLHSVVLEDNSYRAAILNETGGVVGVSIWLKPEHNSRQRNASDTSGMICSSGSGYYDGWRLTICDMNRMVPRFEIGCGKQSTALISSVPLCHGRWNHLVADCDGRWMRIFVNGIPAGAREISATPQPARNALAVGYNNYGVGTLRMAVSELAVFNRPFATSEIVALTFTTAGFNRQTSRALDTVFKDQAAIDETMAEQLRALIDGNLPLQIKVWAETVLLLSGAAHSLSPADVAALAGLTLHPEMAGHLRSSIQRTLLQRCQDGLRDIPSAVLEELPEAMTLNEDEKFDVALALAESYAQEGVTEQAAQIMEHLITVSAHSAQRLQELHFSYARMLRRTGHGSKACEHYLSVANSAEQPQHARALAALALAGTFNEQRQYKRAIEACRAICDSEIALPHHRFEAQQIMREAQNLKAGLPARDPEKFRSRPAALPVPGVEFFVSPHGSDDNSGTRREPFATLTAARDAIRALKRRTGGELPSGGVAVYLRGGPYAQVGSFELSEQDSGTHASPIVYSAWRDEVPVFSGGFKVRKLRRVRDAATLARLPQEARGKVYCADLRAQGFADFEQQASYGFGVKNQGVRSVFADDKFMPPARWPNEDCVRTGTLVDDSQRKFLIESDRLQRWGSAEDMMAAGFWFRLWADEALHVEAVETGSGVITLADKPLRGLRTGAPFYVFNLLEEIDRPGEWYLDRRAGVFYIWPPRHPWFTDIIITQQQQSFVEAEGVHDLIFKGITFQYGQTKGAIFTKCVNLAITGCRFHGFGGTALTVTDAANARIYGNKLSALGHGGMRVSGGNRRTLTPCAILIENNEVAHFGLTAKTYVPAIQIAGVGIRVAHNWMHHAPSTAVHISGNDHIVEYNLTEFVVRESDDQGGVDMWGNASYRGCVMRYNIWRDIGRGDTPCGQAGIRFDDAISGMVVYGNIFERCSNGHFGGVQIHGGHMNIIDNNLFIDCRYAVSFSPWSLNKFREHIAQKTADQLYRQVNIDQHPYSTRYPSLTALKDDDKLNFNSIWRNVIIGTATPWHRAPPSTDFCANRLLPERPAENDGFENAIFRPIPVAEIGCYADQSCAW